MITIWQVTQPLRCGEVAFALVTVGTVGIWGTKTILHATLTIDRQPEEFYDGAIASCIRELRIVE